MARLLWVFSRKFFDYAENASSIGELDERINSCRQLLCETTQLPVPSSHDTDIKVGCFTISITRRESDEEELLLGFVVNELAVCVHLFVFFFHFSSFYVFRVAVGWMA